MVVINRSTIIKSREPGGKPELDTMGKIMKTRMFAVLIGIAGLASALDSFAQAMDPQAVWPLCARITENPPPGWSESQGCPAERFGNAAFTDVPFSSTFGPRPLSSENNRFDFHRGVDIATPIGTPIFAISDANVEIAGVNSGYSDPLIKLRHFRPGFSTCTSGGGCYHSLYLHVSDWVVSVDEQVQKGQLIGYTGASGASGFEHLHFELRDAPAFDVFSAWSRDAIHPFRALPYLFPNNSSVQFNSIDNSDPQAVRANITVTSNRYDLVSVEMAIFDSSLQEVPQAGNTPDANGYHVLPPFYDLENGNFEYSHKDSSSFPWEEFGTGGLYECPYHLDHGASYDANVHMDAQHPGDFHEGYFNGVHIVTNKYWLTGNKDYVVNLEFEGLQGPAACIEATAVFASGDLSSSQWGNCEIVPNTPPVAAFTYACTDLDCTFDGSPSQDPDGTVDAYIWSFGDGGSASGIAVAHSFISAGTYLVDLLVTDNDGASDSVQQSVTVQEPVADPIALSVSTNKKRNRVNLVWSGATTAKVDIYRDGILVSSTRNDGGWGDRKVANGNSYTYQLCETGAQAVCSDPVGIDL